jgi:hypothetical protein
MAAKTKKETEEKVEMAPKPKTTKKTKVEETVVEEQKEEVKEVEQEVVDVPVHEEAPAEEAAPVEEEAEDTDKEPEETVDAPVHEEAPEEESAPVEEEAEDADKELEETVEMVNEVEAIGNDIQTKYSDSKNINPQNLSEDLKKLEKIESELNKKLAHNEKKAKKTNNSVWPTPYWGGVTDGWNN